MKKQNNLPRSSTSEINKKELEEKNKNSKVSKPKIELKSEKSIKIDKNIPKGDKNIDKNVKNVKNIDKNIKNIDKNLTNEKNLINKTDNNEQMNKIEILENTINSLKQEKEQLFKKNQEISLELKKMKEKNQKIEKETKILNEKIDEQENLLHLLTKKQDNLTNLRSFFFKGKIIRQKRQMNHLTEIIKSQQAIRFEIENQIQKNLNSDLIDENSKDIFKSFLKKIEKIENETNILFSQKLQNSYKIENSNEDEINLIELEESLFGVFEKICKLIELMRDAENNKDQIEEINIDLSENLKTNINFLINFSINKTFDWKKPSNESEKENTFIFNPEKNIRNQNIFHSFSEKIDKFFSFKNNIYEIENFGNFNQNLFKKYIDNSPIYFELLDKTIENLKNIKNSNTKNLIDLKKLIYLDFYFSEKQFCVVKYLYVISKTKFNNFYDKTKKTIEEIFKIFNNMIFIAISDIYNIFEKEKNSENYEIVLANVIELYIIKLFKNSNRINEILKRYLDEKFENFESLEDKLVEGLTDFSKNFKT